MIELSSKLEKNFIVGCKLLNADGTNQLSVVDFDNIFNMIGENFFFYKIFPRSKLINRFYLNYLNIEKLTEVDFVKGAFLFCRKSTFNNLHGFDENFYFYAEEADLCYRLKSSNGKVYYYPKTAVIHLGGASVDKILWFKYKNQSIAKIKFYQKHYSGGKYFLLLTIYYFGILIRVLSYFVGGALLINKNLCLKSYYYLKQLFIYPKNAFK